MSEKLTENKPDEHEKRIKELEDLSTTMREENITLKRQVQAYKMREKLPKREPASTEKPTTEKTTVSAAQTEENPHFVGSWQQYCPTCGDKNPDFKDETICDPKNGGCGMHLGAIKDVEKLKACPNCGKTHARRI
jgi:hypothetical protein